VADPRLNHVNCLDARGLHRMAYWEWGAPDNPDVIVCAHGLTRQGRDFDVLAQALCDDFRVVCPDVVGRGRSDWLQDPSGYIVPAYVADMVTLLARLQARTLYWFGTSLGGLIGMGLAGLKHSPVQALVLNDVGPTIEYAALERIGRYVGLPMEFATEQDGADYLRSISLGFGPHTPEQWLALCRPQFRPLDPPRSGFQFHYDPRIGEPFRAVTPELAALGEAQTWALYDAITCPTLLVRGGVSDLLSAATAERMAERGPRAEVHTLPGIGHAPTFVTPDQVQLAVNFFRSQPRP
jgi:pimeloyl-ACP methyl ester carboxylesterase